MSTTSSPSPPPFLDAIVASTAAARMLARVPEPGGEVHLHHAHGALRGLLSALLCRERRRQVVYVAVDDEAARDVHNDAAFLLGADAAVYLGEDTAVQKQSLRTLDDTMAEHGELLRLLAEDPARVVVTDHAMLLHTLPSPDTIQEHAVRVERHAELRQEDLIRRLSYGGFERNEHVSAGGEFAVRGGILDVYPAGYENPLRIEFFGDEVDSIREFDVLSQRSIRTLDSAGFLTSLFLDDGADVGALQYLGSCFEADAVLFIEEPLLLRQRAEHEGREDALAPLAERACFVLTALAGPAEQSVDLAAEAQPAFNGSVKILLEHCADLALRGIRVFLVADSEQQALRLKDILASGDPVEDALPAAAPMVLHSPLSRGFLLPDAGVAVYTEHQIFNRRRILQKLKRSAKGITLRELRQLRPGDYVVHVDKGIGRFEGFETITVAGGAQETAKLRYADSDVLYVNLNYITKLQKYSSEEGAAPPLSKLGSGEWERTRERAKRKLKDIARELIRLYAMRRMAKGHAFSPDTAWQKEMEASFLYEDTPDQHTAAEAVKRDMEEPVPMDRLVCGDVGYGKTEVAVRAAFKAVMDGKQVGVLVPTTILAQQHFNTFQDRLHRYSVTVEALSRFKSRGEQRETLARLAEGKIDILVGTHRLLSADVRFKDLGLLVIDEEHRFGVTAKEKLRRLRVNLDTLTLTATPIPRTLNFSLLGARDLSVIETPPKNRLPIMTSIAAYDTDILAESLGRELARGGQAYVVSDKIGTLERLADDVRRSAPGARLGIAHGQMTGAELERVMLRFLEKKIDVLITTKIIESGLDIPSVNTIIITQAHRFGLAELYQLRGRVGRSNIQAYACLLVPRDLRVTRDALKRLQAIEEFTELGTGFHLAMRDLEIRGAGNLLGAEQSGFIAAIGFDLYLSTIEEAVAELKRDEFQGLFPDTAAPARAPRPDVVMELGLDAFLPQHYVASSTERFELYRQLYNAETEEEIKEIETEVFDRFGLFTQEVDNLFFVVRLRLLAARIRLARVTWTAPSLVLVLPPEDDEEFFQRHLQPVVGWAMANRERVRFDKDPRQVRLVVQHVDAQTHVEQVLRDVLRACEAQGMEDAEGTIGREEHGDE
jgi:transcription-repair coupling factor (superfamily II helicase)